MKAIQIPSSRGIDIPADIYEAKGKCGLTLLAHSFRSDRKEDGRYVKIGETLSENGILCLAMDFAGNGESKQPFEKYSLTSALADLEDCLGYAKANYDIDENRMYLLGYSMGGRIISLFLKRHPEFAKAVFWAASIEPYGEGKLFLKQDLKKLKEECKAKGTCQFYDIFDEVYITMGKEFIDDMLERDALKPLREYRGKVLIIQGGKDITIDPDNARLIDDSLCNARYKKLCYLKEADHGFGLWDGRREDNEALLRETLAFLI
jgi:esterase/lipase